MKRIAEIKEEKQEPKYKFELRAFDGSLNETKSEALRKFQEKYGFKAVKAKTPALSPRVLEIDV